MWKSCSINDGRSRNLKIQGSPPLKMPVANLCLCRTQLSSYSYLPSKVLQVLHKHNMLNPSWKNFGDANIDPALINYTTAQECWGLCSLSHDNAAWLELRMKFRASCETPQSHPPGPASGCMLLPGEKKSWLDTEGLADALITSVPQACF